jgi:aminoglycoside phosphotransferase (APT) family kinase protein
MGSVMNGDVKSQGDHRHSSRTFDSISPDLVRWLESRISDASSVQVELLDGPANGMSNETLRFRAKWTQSDGLHDRHLVARVAPDPSDFPIFRSYNLEHQFRAMALVHEYSEVPVPKPLWFEPDASVLGSPFFVMQYVEGQIPLDVPTYNRDSWLRRASRDQQRRLQDSTVSVVAALHAIPDATTRFAFLCSRGAGETALHRHIAETRAWYEFARRDGARSRLVERGLDWLTSHWPRAERSTVLSWGDARIGNVIYEDFTPVAVLDWEMASLGPRELDLSWLVYSHRVYEELVARAGFAGMPHFLELSDVAASYEALTGYEPQDLDFYLTYAALRWAIVFLRTGTRHARFGSASLPDDPDDLILTRPTLEEMLATP